jgi:hypothetical protein
MSFEIWYYFDKQLMFTKCSEYDITDSFLVILGSNIIEAVDKKINRQITQTVRIPVNKIELIIED